MAQWPMLSNGMSEARMALVQIYGDPGHSEVQRFHGARVPGIAHSSATVRDGSFGRAEHESMNNRVAILTALWKSWTLPLTAKILRRERSERPCPQGTKGVVYSPRRQSRLGERMRSILNEKEPPSGGSFSVD